LFGTVGTGDSNVRCSRGGPLVVLSKWPLSPTGRRWGVSRWMYRLAGANFRVVGGTIVARTRDAAFALATRWGMSAAPFTGCVVDRGRRL
jgi:hypothetical protein